MNIVIAVVILWFMPKQVSGEWQTAPETSPVDERTTSDNDTSTGMKKSPHVVTTR